MGLTVNAIRALPLCTYSLKTLHVQHQLSKSCTSMMPQTANKSKWHYDQYSRSRLQLLPVFSFQMMQNTVALLVLFVSFALHEIHCIKRFAFTSILNVWMKWSEWFGFDGHLKSKNDFRFSHRFNDIQFETLLTRSTIDSFF